MDYQFKIIPDNKLIIVSINGSWNKADYVVIRNEVSELLETTNAKRILFDVRQLKGNSTTTEVFEIASEVFPIWIKYAVVYSENKDKDGLAKFGETVALNRGGQIKVFPDIAGAKQWLAVPQMEYE